ncbi:MAG: sigma-70 family RNA polymerase sigma factor [Verrucomicrobiota bacterium]
MAENQDQPKLNEADFMRLLLQHENALRAFARSLLPSWDAVDDVIQDASVIMWQKLGQLEEEEGFLPWGKVIVRFHCFRYHEQKKKKGASFSHELVSILADEAEKIDEVAHASRRRALETCLLKLSEPERELVFAPYLGHGRITELAELGGTSANALYKKLGRLRDRLRNCVQNRLAHP